MAALDDGGRLFPQLYGTFVLDPDGPTPHAPGSLGKIEVMARRADRRVALFHPLDSDGDEDSA